MRLDFIFSRVFLVFPVSLVFPASLIFLVFLAPQPALGHHGGSEYDLGKTVEFKGKLTGVELINPHSWIYFDVTESDGKVGHHRCEMRSVHVLRRSGWTKERFPVGQQVTIEASPNRIDPTFLLPANNRGGGRNSHGPLWAIRQSTGRRHSGSAAARLRRRPSRRPARRPSGEPNISGDWAPVQLVMVNAKGTGGGLVPLDQLTDYKPGERPANFGGRGRSPAPGRGSMAEPN